MQLDSLLRREILLLELELGSQVEEAQFLFLFRDHLIEEGEVIAEKQDARRIVDLRILADVALEEDCRHGSDVFMAETEIGAGEAGVAGFHGACRASLGWTCGDAR